MEYIDGNDDGYVCDDEEENSFYHLCGGYKFRIVCGLECIFGK